MQTRLSRGYSIRRVALAVLAGAFGVVFIVGGLLLVAKTGGDRPPSSGTGSDRRSTPPSSSPAGARGSSSVDASGTPATGVVIDLITRTPQGGRAAVVAFRSGKSISVSAEDGSAPVPVAQSASGPYALSPDGRTVAFVQNHALYLADVQTHDVISAGDADIGLVPQWQPDSSHVVFRRWVKASGDSFDIWSVKRSGTGAKRLLPGEKAVWSPSGEVLAILNSVASDVVAGNSGGGGSGGSSSPAGVASVSVAVNGGVFRAIPIQTATPTAVGSNGKRVFVGTTGGADGARVLSMALDGSDQRQIAAAVPGKRLAFWSAISASPDGGLLALQANGDDGYARSFLIPAEGGKLAELSRLSDTVVQGFNAAGDRLFIVEGNAFQGEPTSLASVERDGSGRQTVVAGAQ